MSPNALSQLVASTRKRRGLRLDDVRGDISAAAFSRFERGETEIKSSRLTSVFEVLGITCQDLLRAGAIDEFDSTAYVSDSLNTRLTKPAYMDTLPSGAASTFIWMLERTVEADRATTAIALLVPEQEERVWAYFTSHQLSVLDWRLLMTMVRFLTPERTLTLLERLDVPALLRQSSVASACWSPMISVAQILWETCTIDGHTPQILQRAADLVRQLALTERMGAMFAVHDIQIRLRTRALLEATPANHRAVAGWLQDVEPLVMAIDPQATEACYIRRGFLTAADFAAARQQHASLSGGVESGVAPR